MTSHIKKLNRKIAKQKKSYKIFKCFRWSSFCLSSRTGCNETSFLFHMGLECGVSFKNVSGVIFIWIFTLPCNLQVSHWVSQWLWWDFPDVTLVCEDSRMLLMPEQNKGHIFDAQTKQKPCCWCRNKKAIFLIPEQNKSNAVDVSTKQKPCCWCRNKTKPCCWFWNKTKPPCSFDFVLQSRKLCESEN